MPCPRTHAVLRVVGEHRHGEQVHAREEGEDPVCSLVVWDGVHVLGALWRGLDGFENSSSVGLTSSRRRMPVMTKVIPVNERFTNTNR